MNRYLKFILLLLLQFRVTEIFAQNKIQTEKKFLNKSLVISPINSSVKMNEFTSKFNEIKLSNDKPLKISIEAGGNLTNGNTKENAIYSRNNLDFQKENWTEIFRSRLENKSASSKRIKERYDINNQLRYNFSENKFSFSEIEYISDRFSGFRYRLSETFGFGYNLIKEKKIDIALQASSGFRQNSLVNGSKQNNWLMRFASGVNFKITNDIHFDQVIDFSVDKENKIFRSDNSLRIIIKQTDQALYLQLGYFIENRSSKTISSAKNTDSTIMTMIGYKF